MPRRREVPKRLVMPDPKYGDELVTKFMAVVMTAGKKAVAEGIVYGAFEVVQIAPAKSRSTSSAAPWTTPSRWWK